MKRVLPFVLMVAAAGCGGVEHVDPDANPDDPADASADRPDAGDGVADAGNGEIDGAVEFGDDSIARDCAPNDGPAVRITIGDVLEPTCRPDGLGPSLEIYVWVHPITAPQTVTFNDEARNGSATYCAGGLAPCQIATSGTIEFDAFADGRGARGSYAIHFGDAVDTGDFDASWCDPDDPIFCG